MLKEFYRRFQLSFIFIPLVLFTACQGARQTSITMWLQPNTPTLVNFPLTASAQIYSFSANPGAPMQISLYPLTANLPYTAEVHDNKGSVIGTVGSGLQNAVFTIGPSEGLYEVAIKSENNSQQGMLSVQVASLASNIVPAATVYTPPQTDANPLSTKMIAFADSGSLCTAQSSSASNVNIRNGSGMNYPVIGSLAAGTQIAVIGRSDDGWFQVSQPSGTGWISGSVITLSGVCDTFAPALIVTPLPTLVPTLAPLDPNAFHLDIDRDGWGDFSEDLAYTDVSLRDLIMVSVENLTNVPDANYREFTLTLVCSGSGTENIRWGAPDSPALSCGHSFVMPFTPDYNRQMIAVSLPENIQQGVVRYTLLAAKR